MLPSVYATDFYDVPNQPPAVALPLDAVRVFRQQVTVPVTDPLLDGGRDLLCTVSAEVGLGAEQRGIHMSRIEQALRLEGPVPLPVAATLIAARIRETQEQDRAAVSLTATAPILTRTRVTGLNSADTVLLGAEATVDGTGTRCSLALTATNITACPCMQGYTLDELVRELGLTAEAGRALLARVPVATHSQKGLVRLGVEGRAAADLVDYRLLYEILGAATTLTQELLKRPDEYDLVRRVHLRPQFVEDVVRSVTTTARASLAGAVPADRLTDLLVDVYAESHESIHGHDIAASLRLPAA